MNKISKPKYIINSNVLIQQHCNEDMEKIISKYLNHKSSLFFSQKVIKTIAAIFQPNIKDCYLNKKREAYTVFDAVQSPLCLVPPCEIGRISVFEKFFNKKFYVKNYNIELTVN